MVSYRVLGYLGQPEVSPEEGDTASFEDPFAPLTTSRGFVKVPTYDVRQYVQTTLIVLAVGFGAGVGVGAIFGNILGERKLAGGVGSVFRNTKRRRRRRSSRTRRNATKRRKRRTSARRRKRGRPAGGPVTDRLTVKLPDGFVDVHIDRGDVMVDSKRYGSIYDMGTKYQAIPIRGESRSYGTLAGAIKHVLRYSEAA